MLGKSGPTDHVDFDFDFDLSALADNVLEPGESATFRFSFTGGNPNNSDQRTYLDNVAITGSAIVVAIPGDTDGDGDVDDADFGSSFAGYTGPLTTVVPEPASLSLLLVAGLLATRRRHA